MATDPTSSASSIVAQTVTGSHLMEIKGYSSTVQNIGTGAHQKSEFFSAGGYTWYVAYLPNGDCPDDQNHISFFLVLQNTPETPVMADFTLSILDNAGKQVYYKTSRIYSFDGTGAHWGFSRFIEKSTLEKSRWLKDDRFTVRCDVDVTVGFREEGGTATVPTFVTVPPPDYLEHFHNLLLSGEGADVRFVVDDKEFKAHRCILAARSPVFQAQFFGPMQEGAQGLQSAVEITDIKPNVFRNLLSFIYTGSLRERMVLDDIVNMAQYLFVAADKYNVGRLKIMCEECLCRNFDVRTVTTTLALADRHGSPMLKKKSIEFLKRPGVMDVISSEDFEHLMKISPSLAKELFAEFSRK
ncbi:unnamed protein product [Urochloa decumbens]|uniref:Uncharacterized protein n=1 Tax=Urochloa decumbens TaxID=240449 RepID=A0ABC8YJE4_9POAL